MPTPRSSRRLAPLFLLATLLLSGCGYNAMQGGDEAVKAATSTSAGPTSSPTWCAPSRASRSRSGTC